VSQVWAQREQNGAQMDQIWLRLAMFGLGSAKSWLILVYSGLILVRYRLILAKSGLFLTIMGSDGLCFGLSCASCGQNCGSDGLDWDSSGLSVSQIVPFKSLISWSIQIIGLYESQLGPSKPHLSPPNLV